MFGFVTGRRPGGARTQPAAHGRQRPGKRLNEPIEPGGKGRRGWLRRPPARVARNIEPWQEDVGKGWGEVGVLVVGMVVGRFLVLNVTMRDRTIRTNQPLACLQSPLRYGRDAWASVWQPPEAPAGVERHMPQRVKTQPVSISDVLGGAA